MKIGLYQIDWGSNLPIEVSWFLYLETVNDVIEDLHVIFRLRKRLFSCLFGFTLFSTVLRKCHFLVLFKWLAKWAKGMERKCMKKTTKFLWPIKKPLTRKTNAFHNGFCPICCYSELANESRYLNWRHYEKFFASHVSTSQHSTSWRRGLDFDWNFISKEQKQCENYQTIEMVNLWSTLLLTIDTCASQTLNPGSFYCS